jgi:hypothetical protein
VPPRHRHRACDQADHRIDAQHLRRAHPDDVFHDEHADDTKGENKKRPAASREHSSVGAQSDRREEGKHEAGLQRCVERDPHARHVEHREEKRSDQSADNRFRDRVFLQERDVLDHAAADDQHKCCGRKRCRDAEIQVHGGNVYPAVRPVLQLPYLQTADVAPPLKASNQIVGHGPEKSG